MILLGTIKCLHVLLSGLSWKEQRLLGALNNICDNNLIEAVQNKGLRFSGYKRCIESAAHSGCNNILCFF